MLRKSLLCVTLLGLAAMPAVAQEGKTPPTVTMQIRSFEDLISTVNTVSKTIGKEEFAEQLDDLIKLYAGEKGLEGVDPKRPWGLYVKLGEDLGSVSAVAMLPVSDKKALLDLLENLNFPAKKNEAGLYVVRIPDQFFDIGIRFANKYAYITGLNLDVLAPDKLATPGQVFALGKPGLLQATVRVNQIPKAFKDIAISKLEEGVTEEKGKLAPGATDLQIRLRNQVIDTTFQQAVEFLRNGQEVTMAFDVDAAKKEITTSMTVDATKGSKLAKDIAYVSSMKTAFGSLAKMDGAIHAFARMSLPQDIKKAAIPAIEEAMEIAVEKERNPQKRKAIDMVLKALKPSLTSGELDKGVVIQTHDSGRITAVAAVGMVKGKAVETVLKQFLNNKFVPERDRAKFSLDVAKVGSTNIHRLNVQDTYDDDARRLLGDNPVYFAVNDDALVIAVGEGGMKAIKTALLSKSAPAEPLTINIDVAKAIETFADDPKQKAVARKVFNKTNPGYIKVRITGGKQLSITTRSSLSLLQAGAAYESFQFDVRNNPGPVAPVVTVIRP